MNPRDAKKRWTRPQLTVLVRIDVAESVLAGCKYTNRPTGADQVNNGCLNSNWGVCGNACQQQSAT